MFRKFCMQLRVEKTAHVNLEMAVWRWWSERVVEDSETSVAREEVGIVKDDGYKSWRVVV